MKKLISFLIIFIPLFTATLGFAMDAEIKFDAAEIKKTAKVIAAKKIKKGFTCEYCYDVFARKCNFLEHIRKHTGEQPFTCSSCTKKFAHRSSYNRHLKIHTGQKYTCPHCPKMFTDDSSLRRHIKTHTDKKVVCPICGNRLADQSNLKKHIRTHTGEKPFACSYCPQSFSDKSACNRHIERHEKKRAMLLAPSAAAQQNPVKEEPVKEEDVVKIETPAALAYEPLAPDASLPFATALAPDEHKD